MLIAYSLIYMLPLSAKIPFNWRELTPVSVVAIDQFVLWDNASGPKNVKEFIEAAKAASSPFKMGGTGSKREDNVLTVFMEQKTGAKFSYLPYKSGGEAARAARHRRRHPDGAALLGVDRYSAEDHDCDIARVRRHLRDPRHAHALVSRSHRLGVRDLPRDRRDSGRTDRRALHDRSERQALRYSVGAALGIISVIYAVGELLALR